MWKPIWIFFYCYPIQIYYSKKAWNIFILLIDVLNYTLDSSGGKAECYRPAVDRQRSMDCCHCVTDPKLYALSCRSSWHCHPPGGDTRTKGFPTENTPWQWNTQQPGQQFSAGFLLQTDSESQVLHTAFNISRRNTLMYSYQNLICDLNAIYVWFDSPFIRWSSFGRIYFIVGLYLLEWRWKTRHRQDNVQGMRI